MKQKTEKELKENYEKFIKVLHKYFTEERLEKLLHMYSMNELGSNLILSPASSREHYHNAYPGGYIDHIFNVCRNTFKVKDLFVGAGGVVNFTDEEMVFAAIHHDLGKLGSKNNPHYILNDSDWHVKNRGEFYKVNDEFQYMNTTDRTFFTLQEYGIKYNQTEYFAIKLTDGVYGGEANAEYLTTSNPTRVLRHSLPHILHWADHISAVIERQDVIK